MIDFNVPRSKDCILIDTKDWLQNSSQKLTIHRMSGRDIITYLTKALNVNAEREEFKEVISKGDTLLLTRISSEVAQYKSFGIDPKDKRYYEVPIMQVIGIFEDGVVSLDNLKVLFDKILVEKVDTSRIGFLDIPNNAMIGRVVKTGWCRFDNDWKIHSLTVKVNDYVLIRDNVTTEITLGDKTYYASEEAMIVGIFKNEDFSLDSLELINDSILFQEYIPERTFNSGLLTPSLNFEDEDVTDIYNRDLFKICAVDKSLTELQKGDIIMADRNVANYVYLKTDKYFILSGMTYVEAKINEGE